MSYRLFILVTAAVFTGAAQPQRLAGPFLGHIYDSALHELRPVHGIPGAAYTGAPVSVCADLHFAAVSPEQDYAIALCGAERTPYLLLFGSSTTVERLDSVISADRIWLSPRGSAAALYRTAERAIDIITGLPHHSTIRTISLPDLPSTLAVSDDGALVYGVVDNRLLTIEQHGTRSAGISGEIAAVHFRPGTHDATVLIGMNAVLVSDRGNESFTLPDQPVAFEFSRDGSHLFVATAREMLAVSRSGEVLASVPVLCRITSLARLNADSVLRTSCDADTTLRIVELRNDRLRMLVVPRHLD
jgi:hypothetical protein